MNQINKFFQTNNSNQSKKIDELKKEFEQEKNSKTITTRTVKLQYNSCCGCGCSFIDVEREVPYDSELQDGDIIKELLPDDKY